MKRPIQWTRTRFETDDASCGRWHQWTLFNTLGLSRTWSPRPSIVSEYLALSTAASLETAMTPTKEPSSYNGVLVTIAVSISPDFFLSASWPDHGWPLFNCSMTFPRCGLLPSWISRSPTLFPSASWSFHPYRFSADWFLDKKKIIYVQPCFH